MTRKLNDADRAAVDMLFDRITTTKSNGNINNGGDGYVAMTAAVSEERIAAVEKVLSLLAEMPAPEPSPDLAVRTLQRVARASGAPGSAVPAMPSYINPNQPMA